eukprot:scaffold107_cov215-Alexandrium_tamarense.AAC.19
MATRNTTHKRPPCRHSVLRIATVVLLSTTASVSALASAAGDAPSSTSSTSSSSAASSSVLRSSRDYHLMEVVPHDTSSFT